MLVSEFDFELPARLIAQEPNPHRDKSRLLVVDRSSGTFADRIFEDLPSILARSDLLIINNTRVFPARLIGRRVRVTPRNERVTGAKVEVFLVKQREPAVWEALVKPGRSMLPGTEVEFARGKLSAEVLEWKEGGRRVIRFHAEGNFDELIDRLGRTPLPPYIKRDMEDRLDAERYQTIFARERGAVAAPTAGLHFTSELMQKLRESSIDIAPITLHVGYGTFKPVRVQRVEDHQVDAEIYSIGESTANAVNQALNAGKRIVAVGTTTTRALESAARLTTTMDPIEPITRAQTDLFIYPGFDFRIVKALVTNFHLPRSSLLMLVSAFGGTELMLKAYRHAIENEYRFYSYGDAMLIL